MFTIHFRLLYDVRPATGRGWRHIREPQRPPTPEGSYSFYRAPHFLLFSLTHVAFPLWPTYFLRLMNTLPGPDFVTRPPVDSHAFSPRTRTRRRALIKGDKGGGNRWMRPPTRPQTESPHVFRISFSGDLCRLCLVWKRWSTGYGK